MKDVQTLLQQVAVPDSYFWYTLSLVLAVALIGIIWKFAERVSKTLDELKLISKVHEHRHDETDSKIEKLEESVFTVKYRGK